ncbi:MAG: translation initiation factor IF-3 [Gammaproteobacteria bacterium]
MRGIICQSPRYCGAVNKETTEGNALRINDEITAAEVRLISADGGQVGVISLSAARDLAEKEGVDLVEISPDAKPPVCKLLDYGKHKYRENKKRHEARARQKQTEVKEIKFRLSISKADYEVKRRNAERFLAEGNRVKAAVFFRGREIIKQDIGRERLRQFSRELEGCADVEKTPVMEGRRLMMVLSPKKKATDKPQPAPAKSADKTPA